MRKKIQVTTTTVYDKTYTKRSGSKKKQHESAAKSFKSLSIYKIHEKKLDEIDNVQIEKNNLKKLIKEQETLLKKTIIDLKIREQELNPERQSFTENFKGRTKCMSMEYILLPKKCNCLSCELSKRFHNEHERNIYKIKNKKEELQVKLKNIDVENMNYILNNIRLLEEYTLLDQEQDTLLEKKQNDNEENGDFNTNENNKNDLIRQYKSNIGLKVNFNTKKTIFKCNECNLNLIDDESNNTLLICSGCGITTNVFNSETPLSFKEAQDYEYKSKFMYDKKSHFIEWLNRITSSENKDISQDLIDKINIEISKEKITDLNTLTEKHIKKYLKKINMTSYYDNTITIINRINGRASFKLSNQIKEKLYEMFQKTRVPFEKYKKKNRKNFFSYSFILAHFFKILKLDEFTYYLPKLKSQDKIRDQDDIFEKIVKELAPIDKSINWTFTPSI
jgi:hypothetical protein